MLDEIRSGRPLGYAFAFRSHTVQDLVVNQLPQVALDVWTRAVRPDTGAPLRRAPPAASVVSGRWSVGSPAVMAEITLADFEPTDENDVGMKAFFAKQMSTMLVKQAEEYLAHANMWAKAAGIPPTLTIGGDPQPLKRTRGVKKEVAPPSSGSRRTSATTSARTRRLPDDALGLIADFCAPPGGN